MYPVSPEFLDCVIYLYRSEAEADQGKPAGGSGFLVSVPSDMHEGISHIYAVTNAHVIHNGAPVVRMNTMDGGRD